MVNGGAFVNPVLHEITRVNMTYVMRIEVRREHQMALITKDRIRVDVIGEFLVRVGAGRELVAAAAQSRGQRTLQTDGLRELLEDEFARRCAQLRRRWRLRKCRGRGEYAAKVRSGAVGLNGLELESVAIGSQTGQVSIG